MAKGRKRKQAKRTESGQISRAGTKPESSRPSEWVARQRDRFASYYNSALGRAYKAGLLDDPQVEGKGKDRYENARRFAEVYRRVFGGPHYRCALNDAPRGSDGDTGHSERDRDNREWLRAAMARADATGCRPYLDQLVSQLFTDAGPHWLDALLSTKRDDPRDRMVLEAAIKAMDAIASVDERDTKRLTDIPFHAIRAVNA